MGAFNLGGLTAPLWGGLADRYRLHRGLLVAGLLVSAMGLAAFPFITVPSVWLVLALLLGVGASGAATVAILFVDEEVPYRSSRPGVTATGAEETEHKTVQQLLRAKQMRA